MRHKVKRKVPLDPPLPQIPPKKESETFSLLEMDRDLENRRAYVSKSISNESLLILTHHQPLQIRNRTPRSQLFLLRIRRRSRVQSKIELHERATAGHLFTHQRTSARCSSAKRESIPFHSLTQRTHSCHLHNHTTLVTYCIPHCNNTTRMLQKYESRFALEHRYWNTLRSRNF